MTAPPGQRLNDWDRLITCVCACAIGRLEKQQSVAAGKCTRNSFSMSDLAAAIVLLIEVACVCVRAQWVHYHQSTVDRQCANQSGHRHRTTSNIDAPCAHSHTHTLTDCIANCRFTLAEANVFWCVLWRENSALIGRFFQWVRREMRRVIWVRHYCAPLPSDTAGNWNGVAVWKNQK